MFDFLKDCLNPDDGYLTGTLVVQVLDSRTGRGLAGMRVFVGHNLDAALGKT